MKPRNRGRLICSLLLAASCVAAGCNFLPFAPLVNWVQTRRTTRWLMETLAGIDRRRSLPPLYRQHFRRWFRRHRPDIRAGRAGKVLLLADCFTTYTEPAIGEAAVRVLERAGYAVELADMFCCGRVFISKGFLDLAKARRRADRSTMYTSGTMSSRFSSQTKVGSTSSW